MKKLNQLAIPVLAAVMAGLAHSPAVAQAQAPAAQPPAQPAQATPAQPQQKKEIKDPAEYNAYVAAIGLSDPNQKAAALEQFLNQYPNTVMKEDAMQQIMGAYQQANNLQKASDAANKLLQVEPNNVPALFTCALVNNVTAHQGNAQAGATARQCAEKGLQNLPSFTKPEGMAPEAFEKTKTQMAGVFNGAAGFGAFINKDYPAAQKYLTAAAQATPDDLATIYPLAAAYLEAKPLNPLGFWYGARAINLSKGNAAASAQITKYVQTKYSNYHGGTDGWDQLVAAAAASPQPPANFTVTQVTPATEANKLAASKDPKTMDFAEWQDIFTNADPPVAENVWNAIKGVPLAFKATVIQADKDKLLLASTIDAAQANKADTEVLMTEPIPPRLMPKVGAEIGVQAIPVSYDKPAGQNPYMLHMDHGKLVVTKAPARRPATHRKRPSA